ncbi:MAG: hypothetical protein AB7N53_10215 [Candidatus Binatia bacterium]
MATLRWTTGQRMTSISRLAEVSAGIKALRRRLNSLTAQRAFAVAAAMVLLAGAALVGLALRAPKNLFEPCAWAALVAVCAVSVYAVWRARRAWLSILATAHLADRRAALDDRLATVLGAPRSNADSALLPLLIEQTLAQQHEWGVKTLAPHRLAHRLLSVPAALAVLIAVAFYTRPAAQPGTLPVLAGRPEQMAAQPPRGQSAGQAQSALQQSQVADANRGAVNPNPPGASGSNQPQGASPTGPGDAPDPAGSGHTDQPSPDGTGAPRTGDDQAAAAGADQQPADSRTEQAAGEPPEGGLPSMQGTGAAKPADTGLEGGTKMERRRTRETVPRERGDDSTPGWKTAPAMALRGAIREAFGAQPEPQDGTPSEPEPPGAVAMARIGTSEAEEPAPEPDGSGEAGVEPDESGLQAELPARPDGNRVDKGPASPAQVKGRDAGRGVPGASSGTTGPGGLYKDRRQAGAEKRGGSKDGEKPGGKAIAIRLGATSASSGDAPRPDNPADAAALAAVTSGRALPELSPEQSADAALQKVEVSQEYEAIVRRIFTRD